MTAISQYEKYWLRLLKDGKLTIQVPTSMVAGIKKAIIKRKYEHHLRTGICFNPLKVVKEAVKDKPTVTQLTFKLHNLQLKDI